jgi:hypothetical protein
MRPCRAVLVAVLAAAPLRAQETTTLFVPVVLSSSGRNNSFFTSEWVETNKGSGNATVSYAYTDATGGGATGSATNPQPLAAGRQRVVSDVIAYLRGLGIPIPATGNAVGTVRVTFANLHAASDAAITVRTTTPVPPSAPTGRAGLAYFGVPPAGLIVSGTRATLCGLKQNAADRTNVAVQNAGAPGDGDLTLRVTYTASMGNPSPDVFVTLSPGGFKQFALTDLEPSAVDGFVTVSVVSGTTAFYAYAVVNDQFNSDGSFISPLKSGTGSFSAVLLLPTVVETPVYTTEVVLTNLAAMPQSGTLAFFSAALGGPAILAITLGGYEQRTFPDFVQGLRTAGLPGIPPAGGTIVGTLTFTSNTGDTTTSFVGGRTLNPGGGGRYGVFTSGQPDGTGADTAGTWLYGLRQDGENRTNVALVNAGNRDNNPITFHIDLYDGASGALVASLDRSVSPRGFVQINSILATYASSVSQAYARVTRTAGASLLVAYAVVNDGAQPGQRSGDGAVIPMDPFDVYRFAGSWQNTTFSTTGPMASTFDIERISNLGLTTTTVGGNVFGGTAPPPFTIRGANTLSGLVLNDSVPFLGPISATVSRLGVLTGSAPNVPSPNVSAVTFTGSVSLTSISGNYTATLRPSGTANGTFSMTSVP